MKKNLILLATLIGTLSITSCGNNTSSTSSATSTPTPTTTSPVLPQVSEIQTMIETMRKGFSFSASITETAAYYSADPSEGGVLTGETVSFNARLENTFENSESTTGFEATLYNTVEGGTEELISNEVYVLGDDGRVKTNVLTPQNTVEQDPVLDSNDSDNLNYSIYFDNPFNHIIESDFTLVSGNTYELAYNKASYFSSQYLNLVDTIFSGVINQTLVTIEDGKLTSMQVKPITVIETEVDYESGNQTVIFYDLTAVADITFSNQGEAEIDKPTPYETQPYHASLQSAFDRFSIISNYTFTITYYPTYGGRDQTSSACKFYFTNGAVLFRSYSGIAGEAPEEPEVIDKDSDVLLRYSVENGDVTVYGYDVGTQTWTTSAGGSFSALIGTNIEYIHIPYNEIAAEVFTQESGSSDYVAVSEVTDYLGVYLLPAIISGSAFSTMLASGTKITANLDSTNQYLSSFDIEVFSAGYIISSDRGGSYHIDITDYGTTTLSKFNIQ